MWSSVSDWPAAYGLGAVFLLLRLRLLLVRLLVLVRLLFCV